MIKTKNKNIKISFDFDGTLEFQDVQDMAKQLIDEGYNVCILTTRYSDPRSYSCYRLADDKTVEKVHSELFNIAKRLGIKEINFTEFQWKETIIDKLNIDVHLDDNYREEVYVINEKCKAKAVHYSYFNWKQELRDKIEQARVAKSG